MVFNYKWVDKKNGNYAIRRKDMKSTPAGKKIEPKSNGHTSQTHFFILVDKNDVESMTNLYRINAILETITYDYRKRGTDKKSGTRYLTKKDIEDVLNNIGQYRGTKKTKNIETPYLQELEDSKKDAKAYLKKWVTIQLQPEN